jgi:outer membrane protein assembly factor BamB
MEHYLFIGNEGIVVALGAESKAQKWRTAIKKFIIDPPQNEPTIVLRFHNLVFVGYCQQIFKLSAETGKVIWRKRSNHLFSLELALILDGVEVDSPIQVCYC